MFGYLTSRRTYLVVLAVSALALTGCARFIGPPRRANLAGTLWWVTESDAHRPVTKWQDDLDELQALGIDLLVLNGPFVGEELGPRASDPMAALFAELDRRGMRVFLDTLAAPNWWTLTDPADEVARARRRIRMLEERYGKFTSFHGFYIPYELYVFWGDRAELSRTLYRQVSAACKGVAPDKPVLISPFFILDQEGYLGDFRWASPNEYRDFWRETLEQAYIDVVALQDSGEHLSCYTLADRKPFLAAMKAACRDTDTALWVNVEVGELEVADYEEYALRFGEKTHVNDPKTAPFWRGVPAEKLERKLELAGQYSDTAISWGYREFIRPSLGPDAADLYLSYYLALSP